MILRDPRSALRVTAAPYLVLTLLPAAIDAASAETGAPDWPSRLAAEIAFLTGLAWLSVAWHRFILLGERDWPLPPAPPRRVAVYLGFLAVLELLVMLASAVAMMVVLSDSGLTLLGHAGPWAAQALVLLGMFIIYVLYGRLGAILPVVATGRVDRPLEGWRATRGAVLPIALACLALLVLEETAFHSVAALPVDGRVAAIIDGLLQWPLILLGVSLLTSTYLLYVRDRSPA